MKVLMVGATGANAGLVLPELLKRGATVRALVRDRRRGETALQRGASEIAIGDLADAPSLRAACEGVEGVFHINPAFVPHEAQMGVSMVEAAQAAGARKFVFSGVYHPSLSAMVNHAAKQPVEEALYGSDLDFTILQPAMFMQMLGGAWSGIEQRGQITMPYSKHARVSYVDYRDVAEAAALAMTGDRLAYGTFELCAPGMVNRLDIAAIAGEVLGRPVEAGEIPTAAWAAQMPDGPQRDGLAKMMTHYDEHGFHGGNALVLRAILEREPRTLKGFFEELAGRPAPLVGSAR